MDTNESFEADSNVFTLVQQAELDNMLKAEAVNPVRENRLRKERDFSIFEKKCCLKE